MFYGRTQELEALRSVQERKIASFVVIQGRRRIGKSRLVKEFAKGKKFFSFTGLSPTSTTTAEGQRDEFVRQLGEYVGLGSLKLSDWGDIFTFLGKQTEKGKVIILLDEISWMGSKDPDFLGKLKNAWDRDFSHNPQLVLIVCGSVSSWIEKNIISSTAFLGRPSLYLRLEELPLKDCVKFWGGLASQISAYEKFRFLCVTGGVPRYLELLKPELSAEENIKELCFLPHSPLVHEFDRIFSDIFGSRSLIYKEIIFLLAQGAADQEKIINHCHLKKGGDVSEYLNDLILGGFVARDYTWALKSGKVSKLSQYRLKDNYTRFYCKYILPNKEKIEQNLFYESSLRDLIGIESVYGLQFENLVLNNRKRIFQLLKIPVGEIVYANPYFQRATKTKQGCQIDFLIQTRFNTVYVCEIKFSKSLVQGSILQEMEKKIKSLQLPRNFSYRPVLIHVNGVTDDVIDSGFFSSIIDFSAFLGESV